MTRVIFPPSSPPPTRPASYTATLRPVTRRQRYATARGTHTSLTVESAVERFTEAVDDIVLSGTVGRAHASRIRGNLRLRAGGVPGNVRRAYQRNLRNAIAFINAAEQSGMAPEMLLVLLAAFTRDHLVTMNRNTRANALPAMVEAARDMVCPPLREWASRHVRVVDGVLQLVEAEGENGGPGEGNNLVTVDDGGSASYDAADEAEDEDEDGSGDEDEELSASSSTGSMNCGTSGGPTPSAGLANVETGEVRRMREQLRAFARAMLDVATNGDGPLLRALMAQLQSLSPPVRAALGVPHPAGNANADPNATASGDNTAPNGGGGGGGGGSSAGCGVNLALATAGSPATLGSAAAAPGLALTAAAARGSGTAAGATGSSGIVHNQRAAEGPGVGGGENGVGTGGASIAAGDNGEHGQVGHDGDGDADMRDAGDGDGAADGNGEHDEAGHNTGAM